MLWLGAVVAVGFLIVVHEFGHYIVAKWCQMRVTRFSVGFGPKLLGFDHKGTTFQLAPIPFGGFAEIDGMHLVSEVDAQDPYAYPNRPVWQRFLTILAGPLTNFLCASLFACILFAVQGTTVGIDYGVGDVDASFPAHGLLVRGDRILTVNGHEVYVERQGKKLPKDERLVSRIQQSGSSPVQFDVVRDGKPLSVLVPTKLVTTSSQVDGVAGDVEHYRVGFAIDFHEDKQPISLGTAVAKGLAYPWVESARILGWLYDRIAKWEDPQLGSVVAITSEVKKAFELGWYELLRLLMYLNVSLGLFNLFPIPALDGGRLVFLGYEMITRRRANRRIEAYVHMVGVVFLLLLLIFVTVNDIRRF